MAAVPGGLLARFFGRTASEGAAFALGTAVGPVLTPPVRDLLNQSWTLHPVRPPDAGTLAAGVAQGQVPRSQAAAWAKQSGFGDDQFAALIDIANVGPGTAAAFDMWRRNVTNEAGFRRAVKRLGLEQEWIDALTFLKDERLDPAVIAVAVQRGLIHNAGILPVAPPTGAGQVPPMPGVDIDPFREAEASGVDADRIKVLARLVGLPASPDLAAQMVYRGIIDRVDFDRAIAEGNTRNEWADSMFDGFRQIATVADYVQAHLRGHIDAAAMHRGAARHGMSAADADLIYLRSGRPAAPGQMATAAVRGIDGPLGRPMDREQFLLGVAESDIRPEWGPMLWDSRFLYPSLFQLTRLVTSGAIDPATGADWAHKARYAPEVVTALRQSWGGTTTTPRDPHVVKAETQLWTTQHTSYKAGESDAAEVETTLDLLGVPQGVHSRILALWDRERAIARKQLTPTQLKKAWKGSVTNPDTGQPWSRDEALARLESMGYAPADAETFLDE